MNPEPTNDKLDAPLFTAVSTCRSATVKFPITALTVAIFQASDYTLKPQISRYDSLC